MTRSQDPRPNLLQVFDDQHRYEWRGAAGSNWVRAPHPDALAGRGVRRAPANCSVPSCVPSCAASRPGIARGLQRHREGAMGGNVFFPITSHVRPGVTRCGLPVRADRQTGPAQAGCLRRPAWQPAAPVQLRLHRPGRLWGQDTLRQRLARPARSLPAYSSSFTVPPTTAFFSRIFCAIRARDSLLQTSMQTRQEVSCLRGRRFAPPPARGRVGVDQPSLARVVPAHAMTGRNRRRMTRAGGVPNNENKADVPTLNSTEKVSQKA